jgi:hypothetical protein
MKSDIYTYIFDNTGETTILKKLTSTAMVKVQLIQQSLRDSDSVNQGSNPCSPAIKSTTYKLMKYSFCPHLSTFLMCLIIKFWYNNEKFRDIK